MGLKHTLQVLCINKILIFYRSPNYIIKTSALCGEYFKRDLRGVGKEIVK